MEPEKSKQEQAWGRLGKAKESLKVKNLKKPINYSSINAYKPSQFRRLNMKRFVRTWKFDHQLSSGHLKRDVRRPNLYNLACIAADLPELVR